MTTLPPHNATVLYRESVFDPFSTGRVCGSLFGGLRVSPKVEIETQDGGRVMVSPANVEEVPRFGCGEGE